MSGGALVVADAPLALMALAWSWSGDHDASARLERLAASSLLVAASACLWNALVGPEPLWQHWPRHASLAVMLASLRTVAREMAVDLPVPTLLGRLAAYAGGLALAAVSGGWSLGQNALSAW